MTKQIEENSGKLLSREDILSAKDIPLEKVDMYKWGWGGYVFVKGMSGLQRGLHESMLLDSKPEEALMNKARFRVSVLVHCIVDDKGNPLFRDQDVDALNEKNAAALDYLYDIAAKASGLRNQDVEETTKNSQSSQNDASS